MADFRKIDVFFNEAKSFEDKRLPLLSRREKLLRRVKLIMPSLAALLIGFLMLYPSLKKDSVVADLESTMPKKGELEKLHIEQTVFSITDKDNKVSTFTADRLDETEPGSKLVKILNPEGKIPTKSDDKFVVINSNVGYYDQNAQTIKVTENVRAVYEETTVVETKEADYDFNKAYGSGQEQVYAYGDWGKLWAEGFEYYQNQELLILTGNAKVINDNRTMLADKQIRYYRLENRLEAENNVRIDDKQVTLTADKVKGFLTSGDKVTFKKLDAYDNVKIVEGDNTLYADKMYAYFNQAGDVEKIEAFDNVRIETPDGMATGDYGLYLPCKSEVELQNNVVITQDGNVIRGQRAVTNLKTSVSRIIAGTGKKGRVSGVITGATVRGNKNEKK